MSTQPERQFCTFRVRGRLYGLPVTVVQEVVREARVTRVARAPAAVSGLINLRGQIVLAIDLRTRLADVYPPPPDAKNVVVRAPHGPVAFQVDDVGDVVTVSDGQWERAPDSIPTATRELVRGAYKLSDGLLLVVDPENAWKVA